MSTQPPLEDIHAVASRFQAWVGAQPIAYKDGVRELTYDEAVRSKKHRVSPEKPAPQATKSMIASRERKGIEKSKKKRAAASRSSGIEPSKKRREITSTSAIEPTAFRQMLVEKMSILPAAAPLEMIATERRTTALSMRISSAEHALLRRRAVESNISVSCYLRNCFLEVESLRAQLARITVEQELASAQIPHPISAFSSCMQMVRRLFLGKSTALAVRA